MLVTSSIDGSSRVWDANTGTEISSYAGSAVGNTITDAVWSPDGQNIAIAEGALVTMWEASTGTIVQFLYDTADDAGDVTKVAWSPDGSIIAAGNAHHDLVTGTVIYRVAFWDATQPGMEGKLVNKVDVGTIYALAWKPDGTQLAGGGIDGQIKIFDPINGDISLTLAGHPGGLNDLAWSPDGSRLISAGADNTVRVWDAMTGEELESFTYPGSFVSTVDWSPDGQHIAYSGQIPDLDTLVIIQSVSPTSPP